MVDGNIILSVAKAMELLQALSRAEKPLTLAELTDLAQRGDLTVVLAHMERYLAQQPRTLWPRLRQLGVLFQCNAPFFLDWRTRRRAIGMLREGEIHLLGSDCHGSSYRPPRMGAVSYTHLPLPPISSV